MQKTANQIALNNSGLNIQLSEKAQQAIQFLKTQAAQMFPKMLKVK